MDHGGEALVGFVASHGNALELFEFAEEILDEVSPLVDFGVDLQGLQALRHLGDDDLCASFVQLGNDPVAVEGLVGDETAELRVSDQRRDADRVVALAGQKGEANQIAECVCEGQDLGGPAAFGLAYGLALSPPFAPCP
jgi:hypothetical protein